MSGQGWGIEPLTLPLRNSTVLSVITIYPDIWCSEWGVTHYPRSTPYSFTSCTLIYKYIISYLFAFVKRFCYFFENFFYFFFVVGGIRFPPTFFQGRLSFRQVQGLQ